MKENKLERLEKFQGQYENVKRICDPIDYMQKHRTLLYQICEFILEPLEEMKKKKKKRMQKQSIKLLE